MATITPTTASINLCSLLSESKRIINAHSRHFLFLSVLFILPLSFSLVVYPTLQHLLSSSNPINNIQIFLQLQNDAVSHSNNDKTLILTLSYAVFVYLFSLFSVSSVTYSVFHGFYGRPVKILHTVKSVLYSFLPLFITTLVAQVVVSLISLVFVGLWFFLVWAFQVEVDFENVYFKGFCLVMGVCLLIVLLYLSVIWSLVSVIVVVESSWGIWPLRRSAGLVKGLRRVALSSVLFFGFFQCVWIWCSYRFAASFGINSDGWKSWVFVLQIVVSVAALTVFMLYNAAANTVLYMYCKAVHGELAWEIAQEFSREYVSLPFDDGKVPHMVSVVYP